MKIFVGFFFEMKFNVDILILLYKLLFLNIVIKMVEFLVLDLRNILVKVNKKII